jgi:hypothetical protein
VAVPDSQRKDEALTLLGCADGPGRCSIQDEAKAGLRTPRLNVARHPESLTTLNSLPSAAERQTGAWDVTGELTVSALAVIASTTTAVVSIRAQRAATREQTVWKERTDTYLRLQEWVDDIRDWFDSDQRVEPPELEGDGARRASLFSSPFVIRHRGYAGCHSGDR